MMDSVTLRAIQNYFYCPRRWGLMMINCEWQANRLTALGDIVHEKVSDPFFTTVSARRTVERNVPVFCDEFGLYGVVDCLELIDDEKRGVFVEKYVRKLRVGIVEYKKSAPKEWTSVAHTADRMQLLAQKICVDSMLGCDCETEFYFADTKRRRTEVFTDEDRAVLFRALIEMREWTERGLIPEKPFGQRCEGCSFIELCLPKSLNGGLSVRERIEREL